MSHNEDLVWSGSPSQIVNLKAFVFTGFTAFAMGAMSIVSIMGKSPESALVFGPLTFICIGFAVYKWLDIKMRTYEVTTQRINKRFGILNKDYSMLELYRVRDYRVQQPFLIRIFGLGNIILETSDRSHPRFVLPAIRDTNNLIEKLRRHVEDCRQNKKVREFDMAE